MSNIPEGLISVKTQLVRALDRVGDLDPEFKKRNFENFQQDPNFYKSGLKNILNLDLIKFVIKEQRDAGPT